MKSLVAFVVLAIACQQTLARRPCLGCPEEGDPKNPEVLKDLATVMATQNSDDKIVKVLKVTQQVVAGELYKVEFEVENPKTKVTKLCRTKYLSQPWVSRAPQVLSYSCSPKKFTQLYSTHKVNFPADDFEKKVMDQVVDRVNMMSNSLTLQALGSVVGIKRVDVAPNGKEYRIEFTMADTICMKGRPHNFECEVLSRPYGTASCSAKVLSKPLGESIKIEDVQCSG